MRRLCLGGALLLFVLSVVPAAAQPGADLTSFPVLRLEPSARSAAVGGAFAAIDDGDVNALFFNPAVPSAATSRRASFSYLNHLSDFNLGSVAYSHALSDSTTTISGGVRFAHWGTFEGRDEFGNKTSDFGAGDIAVTAGAARGFGPRIRYGANVHLLHSRIDDVSATALAVDFGTLYRVPAQALTLGVTLRHLGTALDGFRNRREELPLDLQVGVSKKLTHLPLLITATAYDLNNLSEGIPGGTTFDHMLGHLTFGAELQPVDVLRVRAGYNHRRGRELTLSESNTFDFAGVSAGFGVTVSALTVDYAYKSWSSLGGLHQFSLQTNLTEWGD